jgi:cyclopropane-fatty-acyl-phospholipid synthase
MVRLALVLNPELYAAEAYMDGRLTLEDRAAIHDFLLLFSVSRLTTSCAGVLI